MACCGNRNNCQNEGDGNSPSLDEITLKAGTVVKLDGLPFQLKADTVVLGSAKNFDLVRPEALNVIGSR